MDPIRLEGSDDLAARLRAIPVFAGTLPAFDPQAASADPVVLFGEWMARAVDAGVREPHAMTLATVDRAGLPNARVLILKGVTADGSWQYAGSCEAAKGVEVGEQPVAAATFYWADLGRQVRLRGRVRNAGPDASARDFLARGPGARAETLVGRQGQPLERPGDVEGALVAAADRIRHDPAIVAEHWTLWEITADEIEFFQGATDRRHTRLRFVRTAAGWDRTLLWP